MMKRLREILIFVVTLSMLAIIPGVLVPDFCYATLKWKSIGPEAGVIRILAIDPSNSNIIYAGTDGGVFKSTNGGDTWSPINSGITSVSTAAVRTLAIDPSNSNIVYAGSQTPPAKRVA